MMPPSAAANANLPAIALVRSTTTMSAPSRGAFYYIGSASSHADAMWNVTASDLRRRLEPNLRHVNESADTLRHFAQLQPAQSLDSQLFDGEAAQHRAVHHRAPQRSVIRFLRSRQIAHESARKTVASARGVVDIFERIRRHSQNRIAMEQHRAIFSAFHDDGLRSHAENPPHRAQQVVLARKLHRF